MLQVQKELIRNYENNAISQILNNTETLIKQNIQTQKQINELRKELGRVIKKDIADNEE